MLDDPGVGAVHPEQGGGAVPDQLQRVPLAVGERSVADGPLHLPHRAGIGDVLDVAIPQLRGGNTETHAAQMSLHAYKTFQTRIWG